MKMWICCGFYIARANHRWDKRLNTDFRLLASEWISYLLDSTKSCFCLRIQAVPELGQPLCKVAIRKASSVSSRFCLSLRPMIVIYHHRPTRTGLSYWKCNQTWFGAFSEVIVALVWLVELHASQELSTKLQLSLQLVWWWRVFTIQH